MHFAILGKPMVSRVARPFVTFSLHLPPGALYPIPEAIC
jgi:hypothetical protein